MVRALRASDDEPRFLIAYQAGRAGSVSSFESEGPRSRESGRLTSRRPPAVSRSAETDVRARTAPVRRPRLYSGRVRHSRRHVCPGERRGNRRASDRPHAKRDAADKALARARSLKMRGPSSTAHAQGSPGPTAGIISVGADGSKDGGRLRGTQARRTTSPHGLWRSCAPPTRAARAVPWCHGQP